MTGQRTFRRITVAELGRWQARRPDALVLDARDAASHARDGWPGALRLSSDNQDNLLLRTERRRPVLIYCHHGRASQTWAQMFADFGFTHVCDLIGGHAAWLAGRADASAAPDPVPVCAPARPVAPELAAWLAREGFADPESHGAHGNTPLMVAAWRGASDAVEALLTHGVALDATNGAGNNALWLACVQGDPKGVERLVRAGAPIDHANKAGATCLMYASSCGKTEVLRTLLTLGADPTPRTQDDFCALDMAANLDCLRLLRHAPALGLQPESM
jgi:rhodanese-related sulfurtransferase